MTDSSPADVVRLNHMVCFNLNAAARAVTAVYRRLLEPLGVTYPQYLVLASLWEYGDLSVGEMARLLQLDYGTMTPLLKRMEKQGMVHRTRSAQDERTVVVTLAAEGEALRHHGPRIYRAICETFDFSPEKAAAAQAVLQPIIERANQATGILPTRKG